MRTPFCEVDVTDDVPAAFRPHVRNPHYGMTRTLAGIRTERVVWLVDPASAGPAAG